MVTNAVPAEKLSIQTGNRKIEDEYSEFDCPFIEVSLFLLTSAYRQLMLVLVRPFNSS